MTSDICGEVHPRFPNIICTRPSGHRLLYHHQEGLMGCFAWLRKLT
jgi:hypothetical protein